ncbi:Peroxiredoxin Q, chloroplastic [Linum perenne]
MASISLPKHCSISSVLRSYPNKPRCYSSQNLLILTTCHSKFHALKFSSNSVTPPSRRAFKTSTIVAAKVNKGQVPPSFTLKDQDGKAVSLSKFKGKPVVVYFYPADESPGCTKQACAFRDSYEKFKKAGAEVVGISGDDSASHKVTPLLTLLALLFQDKTGILLLASQHGESL